MYLTICQASPLSGKCSTFEPGGHVGLSIAHGSVSQAQLGDPESVHLAGREGEPGRHLVPGKDRFPGKFRHASPLGQRHECSTRG